MTLCLFTRILGISGPASFGRVSQVNNSYWGDLDPAAEARELAVLRSLVTGTKTARFNALFARAKAIVALRYRKRAHDTVFKGKWYGGFARYALATASAGNSPKSPPQWARRSAALSPCVFDRGRRRVDRRV